MQSLPKEILGEILYFADIKTLISVYRSKLLLLTYDKLFLLLEERIGIDLNEYSLREVEYLLTTEYTVFLLTTLGKMYHTGFGFNMDYQLEISKDEYDEKLCDFIKKYADEDDEETELAYFPDYKIIDLAKMTIPFRTVILKYRKDNWYRKGMTVWCNEKSTWWNDKKFDERLLPFLNTKPYITVDDPYMHVTISAEKKGSTITIDDVLFATRALAADDTRTVAVFRGGYQIISITDDILTLEPSMDNFII